MFKRFSLLFSLVVLALSSSAQNKQVKLRLIETSDIHSNFFPGEGKDGKKTFGGLSQISSFIKEQREQLGDHLILVDNGDILQGKPVTYYYNFVDTISPHVCAEILNYMKFDAGNIGNHDIEAGRSVMERWMSNSNFPILGANVYDTTTGENPYPPYLVIERDGVKVVILGMITPAIPAWLHEGLWKNLYFADMEEEARKWMKIIRETEKPDAVIGLFHAGQEPVVMLDKFNENASLTIAREVPGFDAVLMGHDHRPDSKTITNVAGETVWVLNPGSDGRLVSQLDMTFDLKKGKVVGKSFEGQNVKMNSYPVDQDYMATFQNQIDAVKDYTSKRIGYITEDLSSREVFFGPTAFVNLIHQLQLKISGADISLTAPLSFGNVINKGDITVNDMFDLYKYENALYVMELSGQEVKDALEESYSLWTNQMQSADDNLLLFKPRTEESSRWRLANFSFNFDSAAGINYTVDVTQPKGNKLNITTLADGTPFDLNKRYKVAVNSYRGNGGGELLTRGAGISQDDLKSRIVSATDKDLRYYLIEYIEKNDTIAPDQTQNWRFIPEEWTVPAAERDYEHLFHNK